ncbi:MAG: hypothetical protein LC799_20635, partial [Actinobacteria bacterium]|nr:hypothetical protein [Actinomycetota bacterium]
MKRARRRRCRTGLRPSESITAALERYLGAPPDAARYRAHRPHEYAGYRAAQPSFKKCPRAGPPYQRPAAPGVSILGCAF